MEVMQNIKEEFDLKKEAAHHLKDELLEEVTEEAGALVARRRCSSSRLANGTATTVEGDDGIESVTQSSVADAKCDVSLKLAGFEEVDGGNEDKSGKSVYFDESAGMWKCRHCIWTYQIGNSWVDHIHQKHFTFGCRGALQEGSDVEKLPEVLDTGNGKLKDVDIQRVLSAVINGKNVEILKNDTFISTSSLPYSTKQRVENGSASVGSIKNETEHLTIDIVDESDEEVLELEFERAVEKMHTHEYNMYCPNCSSRITKVILRRRKREKKTQPQDLLGCLSCFSIFIPKGNILNPLKIFGNKKGPEEGSQSPLQKPMLAPGSADQQQHTPSGTILGVNGGSQPVKPENNASVASGNTNNASAPNKGISTTAGSTSNGSLIIDIPTKLVGTSQGTKHPMKPIDEIEDGQIVPAGQYPGAEVQSPPEQMQVPAGLPQIENVVDPSKPLISKETRSSNPWEVLKSIVYGGLMELITSLSIVSSAAASKATTLNIVALGVANVLGGLIVLFHNLKDLKYEESDEAIGEVKSKYQELLGRKENFVLHTIFSVLSYLVFGLFPPAIYGFTFREIDDRDFKLVAVGASSLVGILLLATAKSYTRGQHNFTAYSKTIVYYVTGAAMASGIAYAAGHLFERFMGSLGWFDAKPVEHLLIPEGKAWSSF